MSPNLPLDLHYTVHAARARDTLDDHERTAFDKGIALLARDPFPDASRPFGSAREDRTIHPTRNTLVEYRVTPGNLLVLNVHVFSDEDILITEA